MTFFQNFKTDRGLIAAHRGARSEQPENTQAAIQAAVGRCDFIEVDIQFTQDAIPVLVHDERLDRTSDIAEHHSFANLIPWRVHELNLRQLKELDFGSWFLKKDPFGTLASGKVNIESVRKLLPQRIITLEEFLSFADRNQLMINLELKDLRGTPHSDIAVNRVIELIHKFKMEKRVLLSSFNHDYLKESMVLAPEIATGALQETAHPELLVEYLQQLGVSAYHPEDLICDKTVVAELNSVGIAVNVFTVNDLARKKELFDMGVCSTFTDFL